MSNAERKAFLEKMSVRDPKRERLLELQRRYDNREIRKKDLTDEEIRGLEQLCDEQIVELKKSTANYYKRIAEIQKKLIERLR